MRQQLLKRLALVLCFAATLALALWAYQRRLSESTLASVGLQQSRLEQPLSEMLQAYQDRALLLERWIGKEAFSKKRFSLPRSMKTQDEFELFEMGQNQINQVLAEALRTTPQASLRAARIQELIPIEERINRYRAQYRELYNEISQSGAQNLPPRLPEPPKK